MDVDVKKLRSTSPKKTMPNSEVLISSSGSPIQLVQTIQNVISPLASPSAVSNSCSHDEATSIVSDKERLAKESFQLICDAPLGDLLLRSQEKYGPITKI